MLMWRRCHFRGGQGLRSAGLKSTGLNASLLDSVASVSEASSLVTKPSAVDYSDLASILMDGFDPRQVWSAAHTFLVDLRPVFYVSPPLACTHSGDCLDTRNIVAILFLQFTSHYMYVLSCEGVRTAFSGDVVII